MVMLRLLVLLVVVALTRASVWMDMGAMFGGGADDGDVIRLTDANFEAEVITPKLPFFVEFYAPWCHHCRTLVPIWKSLATTLKGKIKIGWIDCQDNEFVKMKYQIGGFPTLILFHRGKQSEFRGARTEKLLLEFLKSHHAVDGSESSQMPEIDTYEWRGRAESIRLALVAAKLKNWKDNFYAEKGCMWRQTGGCSPKGDREPDRDLRCDQQVPGDWSGYCECSDGKRAEQVGCSHKVFKCIDHCPSEVVQQFQPFTAAKFSADQSLLVPPSRQLPILTLDHDPFPTAGVAIRSIGRKYKLYGDSVAEQSQIDMLIESTDNFLDAYDRFVNPSPADPKTTLPTDVLPVSDKFEIGKNVFIDDSMKPWLAILNRNIMVSKGKGSAYVVGKKLSVGDTHAFHAVSLCLGLSPRSLDQLPMVRDWFAEVGTDDGISEYLSGSKRLAYPNSPTAVFGNAAKPDDKANNPFKA